MDDNFKILDIKTSKRFEYLSHFTQKVPCTYSLCVDIDITNIKKLDIKIYPVLIFLISKSVNCFDNFKMNFDENDNFGIFSQLHPSYTIFNKTDENFLNIWTEYLDDFYMFYKNALADINLYQNENKMFPKKNMPKNVFNISAIPWINFSNFNLNLQYGYKYLLPIFTLGKFKKKKNKYFLPLHMQVHHGVIDGYHVSLFLDHLNENIKSFKL